MTENKEPEMRFQGFSNVWEQCKLKYLADFTKGNGYSKNDLSKSGVPIVLYGRLYTKYETVISEVDTFAAVRSGSVYSYGGEIIVPASGETAEDIARASVVEKPGIVLGGDLNIIIPHNGIESIFLALSISNGRPHKDMSKLAQGKSVVHLHNTDLEKVELLYPTYEEQRKIGEFFNKVDNLIAVHYHKCEKLVNFKKAMLKKMFPQNGSDVPEIRFKGSSGSWEWHRLGECFEERRERSEIGELISVSINSGIIRASELKRFDNSSYDKSNYKKVEVGDIAYNSMRMWQGASGCSSYSGILSPAYVVVIPNECVDSLFFSYMFKKPEMIHEFQIKSQGMTSDTWNLKYHAFSEIEVNFPPKEEQVKIGQYFRLLDNRITLHKQEHEKLTNIKKALLEKMFI